MLKTSPPSFKAGRRGSSVGYERQIPEKRKVVTGDVLPKCGESHPGARPPTGRFQGAHQGLGGNISAIRNNNNNKPWS